MYQSIIVWAKEIGLPSSSISITSPACISARAYWLSEVVDQERRPSTASAYRTIVERYIVPRIGRCRLDALGPQDVRRLLNSCREATVTVGEVERPVSARTVQMVHAVLRNAVEHAVREELVPRNVVKLVRVPAPHYEVGTGLSMIQARRLLTTVRGDRLQAVYVLAVSAGLRRASCWACAGSMSTWTVPSCTSGRRSSGLAASCASPSPRPGIHAGPFRCRRYPSMRCGSTGHGKRLSGWRPARRGATRG